MLIPKEPEREFLTKPPEGVAEAVAPYAAATPPWMAALGWETLKSADGVDVFNPIEVEMFLRDHPSAVQFLAEAMQRCRGEFGGSLGFLIEWMPPTGEDHGDLILNVRVEPYPKDMLARLGRISADLEPSGCPRQGIPVVSTDFGPSGSPR